MSPPGGSVLLKCGTVCLDPGFPQAATAARGWLSLRWLPEKGVGGGRERGQEASVFLETPAPPPAALLPPLTGLKGDPRTRSWLSMKLPVHDSRAHSHDCAPDSVSGEGAQKAVITVTC